MSIKRIVEIEAINIDGDEVTVRLAESEDDMVDVSIGGSSPVEVNREDLVSAIIGFANG